jgi:hypothetical protein
MLKFKVGDRVRTVATFVPKQLANREATVIRVDIEDTDGLPYKLNFDYEAVNWASEAEVTLVSVRTPEAIRAEIAALEAELAEATTLKVGATVTSVGRGIVIDSGAKKTTVTFDTQDIRRFS